MRVALGVGGGIAAYKAAELARALLDRGATVQVIMTDAALEFVTPLTFAALTGRKVITSLFSNRGADEVLSSAVEHIHVAQDNDALLVAPATADLLAKFAHGLAGDFLTTTYLAFTGRVILAPAMNTNMWLHAATQANLDVLRGRGHTVIEPETGLLACGTSGPGRLAEPGRIADEVVRLLMARHGLEGETVLLTAGPTQEALEPVRYISNRSSGKMRYALAEAAALRGARVILVSGPANLPVPAGVELVRVKTALEMSDAVMGRLEEATIVIKAAAVADYHLREVPAEKTKKTASGWMLSLEPTPDILAEVGRNKGDRLLVGFAAETQNLEAEGRRKLEAKNCDMVVANLVGQEGTGFESDSNAVTLVMRTGANVAVPRGSKRVIAERILDQVMTLRQAPGRTS